MRSSLLLLVAALVVLLVGISGSAETAFSHHEEVVLEVELASSSGAAIPATITRVKSVESIPFWVEYDVQRMPESANCRWTLELPLDAKSPIVQEMDGTSVRFVSSSNAKDHIVALQVTMDGIIYEWEETTDFPLHCQTEILLDASQFGSSESRSVLWSAHNWTPDDAVTFPIRDPLAPSTTLASEWPNVLYVSCNLTDSDGAEQQFETEALIYWQHGPPFEIRGMMAMYQGGFTDSRLKTIMDQEFPLLRDLGVNLIVHQHKEYYDRPDPDGTFDIHPLYRTWQEEWPSEGHTPPLDQLETYLTRASEEGFGVHVQVLQQNYPSISGEYHQSGWGSRAGFMRSEPWFDALLEHYERVIPFFANLEFEERPVVASMTIAAEQGWVEEQGGIATRRFQSELLASIRDSDSDDPLYFSGDLFYAHSYFHNLEHPEWPPLPAVLMDPQRCGIPWDEYDLLESTFYPTLTDRRGATIQEMLDEMLDQIDEFLAPWSQAYGGMQIFLGDVQCNAVSGAGIWPAKAEQQKSEPFDPVEQLNWFAAILRGIALANQSSTGALFQGLSMGYYHLIPDSWLVDLPPEWGIKQPYVNDANGRRDLQLFVKAHYSDNPAAPVVP